MAGTQQEGQGRGSVPGFTFRASGSLHCIPEAAGEAGLVASMLPGAPGLGRSVTPTTCVKLSPIDTSGWHNSPASRIPLLGGRWGFWQFQMVCGVFPEGSKPVR